MIAVTGMHRSGTSCITGLLTQCGFSLGSSHALIQGSRPDNPKGHYENLAVAGINAAILQYNGASWCSLPSQDTILATGRRFVSSMQEFASTFDGDVIKDPRICLTAPLWEEHCKTLTAYVFCLRNPVSTAASLVRRNQLPGDQGLALWYEYNRRFLSQQHRVPVHIVDYDAIGKDTVETLRSLLRVLGVSLDSEEIAQRIEGSYDLRLNHYPADRDKDTFERLPQA